MPQPALGSLSLCSDAASVTVTGLAVPTCLLVAVQLVFGAWRVKSWCIDGVNQVKFQVKKAQGFEAQPISMTDVTQGGGALVVFMRLRRSGLFEAQATFVPCDLKLFFEAGFCH